MAATDLKNDTSDPLARTVDVERDRVGMQIDEAMMDFVNENSGWGGRFRSHGDAVERGWGRLRTEYNFIRERCAETKTPFVRAAFDALYAPELAAAMKPIGGPGMGQRRSNRVRVFATTALESQAWAKKIWITEGPCKRLGEVGEIGIRRLEAPSYPLSQDSDEPRMQLPPEKFWRLYLKKLEAIRKLEADGKGKPT